MPIHHFRLGAEPTSTDRVFQPIANAQLGATSCSVHDNVVAGGAVIPLHKHAMEEVLVCLGGTAECSFNGGSAEPYSRGSVVVIPANTPHTIRNTGSGLLHQLSIFAGEPPRTEWLEPQGRVQ